MSHGTSRIAGLVSQPRQEEHRAAHRLQKNADRGWGCRNIIITWLLTMPPSEEVFHSTDSEKGGGGGRRNETKKVTRVSTFWNVTLFSTVAHILLVWGAHWGTPSCPWRPT